jgi:cell pole-organizing protein PopZ
MALLTNMGPTSATTDDSTVEADQVSRLKRYDRRVEEWLASLKDEAEQRSPEVLGALAAKAKDVAEYLDKMAERVRSKQEVADDSGPSLPAQATSDDDESSTSANRDPDRA